MAGKNTQNAKACKVAYALMSENVARCMAQVVGTAASGAIASIARESKLSTGQVADDVAAIVRQIAEGQIATAVAEAKREAR